MNTLIKKIAVFLLLATVLFSVLAVSSFAAEIPDPVSISSAEILEEDGAANLVIVLKNNTSQALSGIYLFLDPVEADEILFDTSSVLYDNNQEEVIVAGVSALAAYDSATFIFPIVSYTDPHAKVNCEIQFTYDSEVYGGLSYNENNVVDLVLEDILTEKTVGMGQAIMNFLKQTGAYLVVQNWKVLVMLLISFGLIYLAIVKKFEPLLLLPIAFGMLLTNLPGANMFHEELFAEGHVHWDLFTSVGAGLIDYLYLGVKLGIYPCLIFLGIGAMTDFGPLIANPKSLLLGAAAQIGIFVTFLGASALGFTSGEAGAIGIIGGADGPTAIFVTSALAAHLLGPIAVAAYSYMALVPFIQPPIMRLLTTKKERRIVMKELRPVSKKEKILFPIAVTVLVALIVPSATPLVGCLMLGNLMKESGVVDRISKTAQNELMNIVTIFLGISVGATATADAFLSWSTIKIMVMGVIAFAIGTAGGVLLAKFMNLFLKNKINPLIGSAGVSAVPMAARVSQAEGQKEDPSNFLLMHAMGPNVAGVIGSAIAAGVLIALFG